MIDEFGRQAKIGDRVVYIQKSKNYRLVKGTIELIDVKLKWNGDTLERILITRDYDKKALWMFKPQFMILDDNEGDSS